jgi:hypothetical protein
MVSKDNAGIDPIDIQNNTVFAKALLFKIHINEYKYYCSPKISLLGVNNSYAMISKVGNDYNYDSGKFTIYTNNNYDSSHPAGTDLKDLFVIKGEDYYLMHAPEDTSTTYVFTAQLVYRSRFSGNDTTITVNSPTLKLKK